MMKAAADAVGIPMWFALATAIAESGLNPRAERWGGETVRAKTALATEDWTTLTNVIQRAGADISFGYGQQIILYHYAGNRLPTIENCLAVRQHVFANPQENLHDMCGRLAANVKRAERDEGLWRVNGDPFLGALIIYNAGSLRTDQAWWNSWAGNVASYRAAIARAKALVGNL